MGTADFRVSLVCAAAALLCMAVTGSLGNVHASSWSPRLVAVAGSALFLALATVAVRHAGTETHRVLSPRVGASHAGVVRLLINLSGFTVAVLATLGMLSVPLQHLLLGGAFTGVIVGIAAQQSLGNVFAGLVLVLARPFNVGDPIRIRCSILGGELLGTVAAMGLTYVTLEMSDGPVSIPNSLMLGSGIGPQPRKAAPPGQALHGKRAAASAGRLHRHPAGRATQ
jgi:small-conductance mechanosensitive channel